MSHCQMKRVDEEGRLVGVGHTNPMVDTRKYKVEYEDGSTIEVLLANLLAENILKQVDEFRHKHHLMEESVGHRKLDNAVSKEDAWYTSERGTRRWLMTTKGWEIYVIWKDGSLNFIPLREMKESFPIETAKEPAFAWWIKSAIKKRD